ncbi:hypothetical protein [Streptomyces sp. NPDC048057]|uniref:hypothetical protein n=1 Tax=Streptomyces sp. NPDC048057 TaxID=3155628 RepID=UPI0033C292E3
MDREIESYDLTIKHIGRDGQPAPGFVTLLAGMTGLGHDKTYDLNHYQYSPTHTLPVPAGSYFLTSLMYDQSVQSPVDVVNRPYVNVDRDTTVTLDSRITKPIRITVPDPTATSIWTKGPAESYQLAHLVKGRTLPTGFEKDVTKDELATITAELGSPVAGSTGVLEATARFYNGWSTFGQTAATVALPGKTTMHVNTAGVRWHLAMQEQRPAGSGAERHVHPRPERRGVDQGQRRVDL